MFFTPHITTRQSFTTLNKTLTWDATVLHLNSLLSPADTITKRTLNYAVFPQEDGPKASEEWVHHKGIPDTWLIEGILNLQHNKLKKYTLLLQRQAVISCRNNKKKGGKPHSECILFLSSIFRIPHVVSQLRVRSLVRLKLPNLIMHGRVSFTGDKKFVVFSEFFTLQNSSTEAFLFVNHKKTLERRPNYRNVAEIFPFFSS